MSHQRSHTQRVYQLCQPQVDHELQYEVRTQPQRSINSHSSLRPASHNLFLAEPGTRVKKMIDLVDIANALGHKDPKTTTQVYINHDEQDLIDFAKAVEQAVEAGYKQAISEEVRPDQESNLVS